MGDREAPDRSAEVTPPGSCFRSWLTLAAELRALWSAIVARTRSAFPPGPLRVVRRTSVSPSSARDPKQTQDSDSARCSSIADDDRKVREDARAISGESCLILRISRRGILSPE